MIIYIDETVWAQKPFQNYGLSKLGLPAPSLRWQRKPSVFQLGAISHHEMEEEYVKDKSFNNIEIAEFL